ncbi:MAG TPA: hypothetical protein V6C97_09575 [Oculatellaceae cyanobacterium]
MSLNMSSTRSKEQLERHKAELHLACRDFPNGMIVVPFQYISTDQPADVAKSIVGAINDHPKLGPLGIRAGQRHSIYLVMRWPGSLGKKVPIAVRSPRKEIKLRQVSPRDREGIVRYRVIKGCEHCDAGLHADFKCVHCEELSSETMSYFSMLADCMAE